MIRVNRLKAVTQGGKGDKEGVPHPWCALFFIDYCTAPRDIEKVEGGERDTQVVHVNEATAV
jgi:hypothetical protein